MSSRTLKVWIKIHEWSSLICSVFALLLCVTGLPLIFLHEIDHALGHLVDPPEAVVGQERISIDEIVRDAEEQQRPGHKVRFLVADPDEPNVWFTNLGKTVDAHESSGFFTYDAQSGDFLADYPLNEGLMNIFLRLHIDLFSGLAGMLFLGCMGLVLLVAIGSGVVIYGPFMKKNEFAHIRADRSHRTQWIDIHNLLGIVTTGWLVIVTATGVINTVGTPLFAVWQSTELKAMVDPYLTDKDATKIVEGASVDRAVAAVVQAFPDRNLSFVAFPGNAFASPRHFVAYMAGNTPWTSKMVTPVLIDAETSEVKTHRSVPWYFSAALLAQPLHFGNYGGMPMKVLWAILDIISIFALGTGIYLWVHRKFLTVRSA